MLIVCDPPPPRGAARPHGGSVCCWRLLYNKCQISECVRPAAPDREQSLDRHNKSSGTHVPRLLKRLSGITSVVSHGIGSAQMSLRVPWSELAAGVNHLVLARLCQFAYHAESLQSADDNLACASSGQDAVTRCAEHQHRWQLLACVPALRRLLAAGWDVRCVYHAAAPGHVKLPSAVTDMLSSCLRHIPSARFGPPRASLQP